MDFTTYSGKKLSGELLSFRSLSTEEIDRHDDKSTVKMFTMPGTGVFIANRIAEHYVATIKTEVGIIGAMVHADDVIKAHSGKGQIYTGYRNGSLKIFQNFEGRWYNRSDDEGSTVTAIEALVFDHLSGKLDIEEELIKCRSELISAQRFPAVPAATEGVFAIFGGRAEETDKDFAQRIVCMANRYQRLINAKNHVEFNDYHLI
jgi:hypothetical protein